MYRDSRFSLPSQHTFSAFALRDLYVSLPDEWDHLMRSEASVVLVSPIQAKKSSALENSAVLRGSRWQGSHPKRKMWAKEWTHRKSNKIWKTAAITTTPCVIPWVCLQTRNGLSVQQSSLGTVPTMCYELFGWRAKPCWTVMKLREYDEQWSSEWNEVALNDPKHVHSWSQSYNFILGIYISNFIIYLSTMMIVWTHSEHWLTMTQTNDAQYHGRLGTV